MMPSTRDVSDAWDPEQYARFRAERQQPFKDLLRLVLTRSGMRVVDLGCGTGELSRKLHRHLKAARTRGIDSSAAMLQGTPALVEAGLSFEQGRIEDLPADGTLDLVFSNAALHWVPDHPAVLARLHGALAPGGQLAVQMPINRDAPEHVVADELLREEPFASASGGGGIRQYSLPLEQYATLLWRLGFRQQHVGMTVYAHPMPSREGIFEWVKGALLTDVRRRLDDALWARFLEQYRERLFARVVDERPTLYTMKRAFLWAEK